jgi:hypothetical protein
MRALIVALPLIFGIAAQPQQPFSSLMGTVTGIAGDQLTIRHGSVSTLLYADKDSQIWRGKTTNTLSILQLNDEVLIRYRRNPTRGLVILDLYANIAHIWGRIVRSNPADLRLTRTSTLIPNPVINAGIARSPAMRIRI